MQRTQLSTSASRSALRSEIGSPAIVGTASISAEVGWLSSRCNARASLSRLNILSISVVIAVYDTRL